MGCLLGRLPTRLAYHLSTRLATRGAFRVDPFRPPAFHGLECIDGGSSRPGCAGNDPPVFKLLQTTEYCLFLHPADLRHVVGRWVDTLLPKPPGQVSYQTECRHGQTAIVKGAVDIDEAPRRYTARGGPAMGLRRPGGVHCAVGDHYLAPPFPSFSSCSVWHCFLWPSSTGRTCSIMGCSV